MVEGTPLLREHTGLNLYRGFESLRLRQTLKTRIPQGFAGFFIPITALLPDRCAAGILGVFSFKCDGNVMEMFFVVRRCLC